MNTNLLKYNVKYPSTDDLKNKAKKRIPKFAFDYLVGGCNDEVNIKRNIEDLQNIQLMPQHLSKHDQVDMKTELFGELYDAPFGISPIGLQGLIWPNSPEILSKAAAQHNIPYILSTVSTSSIEQIAEVTKGKFWFQLYHPTKEEVLNDILNRLKAAECHVLVVLIDVPSFGFRYREIKAGLSMPPKTTLRNFIQAVQHPRWCVETMNAGIPSFATLKPYMKKNMNMNQLGKFMNSTFTGRIDIEKLAIIRDKWKGKLVVKGVISEQDAEVCATLGVDGVIISNHGGRQIDVGESSIKSLIRITKTFKGKYKIMIDSGLQSGPDIGRALACGADFTFMGRPFMYGVGALGKNGGNHTIALFKTQLKQIMEQLGCETTNDFITTLIKE